MPLSEVAEELIKNCLEKDFTSCRQSQITCNVKLKHLHCLHCPKVFTTPSSCKRHFKLGHLKRAVTYNEHVCLPCKVNHKDYSTLSQIQAHYHCPVCNATVLKQNRFFKHLHSHENNTLPAKHSNENKAKNPSSGHNFKLPELSDALLVSGENGDKELEMTTVETQSLTPSFPELKSETSTTRKCPICKKILHKKSLARHCRQAHGKVIESTVCVDKLQGLFFVLRSRDKSDTGFRIHVKKVLEPYSRYYGVDCEDDKCSEYMAQCWGKGFKAAECHHLQEVYSIPFIPSPVNLNLEILNKTFSIGDYDKFDKQRIEQCRLLHKQATDLKIQTIVAVLDGKELIHFSVYAGLTPTKFGRIGVVADFKEGVLDCMCCEAKQDCIHKDICLWYLKQNNLLNVFVSEQAKPEKIVLKQEIKEEQFTVIVNEEMPTLIRDILTDCRFN